jgi:hypothetical protein
MKRGTIRHEKVYRLAKILEVRRAEAIGILTALWELASDHYPDGNLHGVEAAYLAEQCLWHGEGNQLVDALVECKLLDRLRITCRTSCNEVLFIHNWDEHCETSVHNKLARSRGMFANGKPPKLGGLGSSEKPDATTFYRNSATLPKSKRRHSADIAPTSLPKPLPLPLPLPKPSSCTESPNIGDPEPTPIVVLVFPVTGGKGEKEWPLTEDRIAQYRETFPELDVLAECRKAKQWIMDNKRKTFQGMPKFLTGWLNRTTDRGGGNTGGNGTGHATIPAGQAVCDQLFGKRATP